MNHPIRRRVQRNILMPAAGSADTRSSSPATTHQGMKSVTDRIQQLKQSYSRQLPGRIAELEKIWGRFTEDNDPGGMDAMLDLAHNLAGSGGVYGYPRISTVSRDLHRTLLRIKEEQRAPSSDERHHIEKQLRELQHEAAATPR